MLSILFPFPSQKNYLLSTLIHLLFLWLLHCCIYFSNILWYAVLELRVFEKPLYLHVCIHITLPKPHLWNYTEFVIVVVVTHVAQIYPFSIRAVQVAYPISCGTIILVRWTPHGMLLHPPQPFILPFPLHLFFH